MRRREFVTLLVGGAAAMWPFAARAQQPAVPLVGILSSASLSAFTDLLGAFREGLKETGDPRFNSIWTLAGTPCITLPAGAGTNGLPLGVQLVGLRHADDKLISTAAWIAARL